ADQHGCVPPPALPVNVTDGGVTNRNFCLNGPPIPKLGKITMDDSQGNNNGVINRDEGVKLDLPLRNDGCSLHTGVSAVLSTSTAGVTITQANSNYPNIPTGGTESPITRYGLSTSPSFVCGTNISLTLTVTDNAGTTPLNFTLPSCQSSSTQNGSITN